MSDPAKKPLQIPPWQIPYLEKHRIFELFHELARELIIQQPEDHVLFIKQILYNAARCRDTARAVILGPPKVNCLELARSIAAITKQLVITDQSITACHQLSDIKRSLNSELKAQYIAHLVRRNNAYELGWLLVDCIKSEQDAKALLRLGILPTHVLLFIPHFFPPTSELIYCHVPSDWPQYRRQIVKIKEVFKNVLNEVYLQERDLEDIVSECVELLNIKAAKYPIKPRVLILGPRGSGRKTQARYLVQGLRLVHIDFERLICQMWMSETELGKKLRACKSEVCMHSELLAEVIHRRVLEEDCLEHGWVLTGFPFTKKDFEYLDCIYTPPNRVIFLECELSICKERILSRKINVHTGSVTNVKEDANAEEMKELKTHPKDTKNLVDAEIAYYCEQYGDIKKYCGASAHCVNGNQSERWVYETILAIISRAPPPFAPRRPFQDVGTPSSSDICCCTPVPSQVLDCYTVRL